MSRRSVQLRAEDGMTLIELLIAMTVMAIGITAIVAGYSSGILAVNRAKVATTAGALADRQIETYRQGSFASVPTSSLLPTTPTGPDGHPYSMQVTGGWSCAVGAYSAGACSGSPPSRPVKLVTIEVSDGSSGRLLFKESATFDSSTG